MAGVLLALFPVLYIFHTRLGFIALGIAIMLLIGKRTATPLRRRADDGVRAASNTTADPWNTEGLSP